MELTLSRLAYECIKDSITIPNSDFDYDKFTQGVYDNDSRYSMQSFMVFDNINKAIARLSDYDKLPYIALDTYSDKFNGKDYVEIPEQCGILKNIYYKVGNDYRNVEFREDTLKFVDDIDFEYDPNTNKLYVKNFEKTNLNENEIYSLYDEEYISLDKRPKRDITFEVCKEEFDDLDPNSIINLPQNRYEVNFYTGCYKDFKELTHGKVYSRKVFLLNSEKKSPYDAYTIEFSEDIPHFEKSDIVRTYSINDVDEITNKIYDRYTDNNIDLRLYGIKNSVFMYIKEFVKAQTLSVVDPKSAQYLSQIAETYFQNLPTFHTPHQQSKVDIGDYYGKL